MKLFARTVHRGDIISKALAQEQVKGKKVNVAEVENLNKYLIYEKAFEHLAKIDLENPEHAECVVKESDLEFTAACEKMLNYYIDVELYERCSTLKEILDFAKFSQSKLQ